MGSGDGLTNARGNLRHHHSLTTRDGNQVHLVATIIGLLNQGQRQGDLLFGTSVEVHTSAGIVVDTHHLIVGGVDADGLATRVSPLLEQFLVYLLTQHAHLPMVAHIHLVDIAAIVHPRRHNIGIFWGYALNTGR